MPRQNKDINADVLKLVRQIQALIPIMRDLQQAGIIDAGNSTDETLGAGGTYTGEWTVVSDRVQAAICVSVTGASAVDGLVFQHSADGSTVLHSHSYGLAAGASRHYDEPLLADFFRVVYTDGGAGGDIAIETKLFNSAPTAHPHALSELFDVEHGANIVRSILSGFDAVSGLSKNVSAYGTSGGPIALVSLLIDAATHALDIKSTGEVYGLVGSTDDTKANAHYLKTDASGVLSIVVSSGSLTADTELPAAAALTDNMANPTAPAVAAHGMLWDGATWDRMPGTSAAGALIQSGQLPAVLAAGGGLKVEGVAGGVAQPVSAASGTIASGAIAAGAIAAGATSIAANEDDLSANADRGVKVLVVQQNTPADTAGNGDYCFLQVSAGRLWCSAVLTAGSAIIGKVGIDQTTPGTTNAVAPIAGQAGVQGGSGVTNALTQRVVLATDVDLPEKKLTAATVPAAFTTNAAGASATYATALASDEWRFLHFTNKTDTDFAVSVDASTLNWYVPAGMTRDIDLHANGLKITATVSYKYLTAPTRGDFYVDGLAV